MKLFALFALMPVTAMAAQYFCVAPPFPCQQLVQMNTWQWTAEAAVPHYLHTIVNGHDYGRAASGTFFDVPNSVVVPDKIFAARFDP
jgi:hypothetical protein